MGNQKQAVMDLVEQHREEGRRISEVLGSVGVARSSYYRWRKGQGEKTEPRQISRMMSHWLFKGDFLTTDNPWSS